MKYSLKMLVVVNLLVTQFCFAGFKATIPSPEDKMEDVKIGENLSWINALSAEFVDVYLNDDKVVSHLDVDSYDPSGNFDYSTAYSWRVDTVVERGSMEKIYTGDTWLFTTQSQVPEPPTVALLGFGCLVLVKTRKRR